MLLHLLLLSTLGGTPMVAVPSGELRPLYGRTIAIASFSLDRDPVTRGEFLAFVRSHPRWRRDEVADSLAGRGYLAAWLGPLDAGSGVDLRRPVTGVSWHAARAYCAAQDKRLPTLREWEYAAAASGDRRDASRDPAFRQSLVVRYTSRRLPIPPVEQGEVNAFGLRGMHGLAWEWVEDFAMHAHDLACAGASIGASDPSNYPAFLRHALRAGLTADGSLETLGFRCAR